MSAAEAKQRKKGLGRGLNALFEDEENFETTPPVAAVPAEQQQVAAAAHAPRGRLMVNVEELYRNEGQPRQTFSDASIAELAASIKEHGILQPIVVREIPSEKGKYQIVAGERRWRASQVAQLHQVPISIVELDDEETMEVALIENLQREDLNPVEEALGYHHLLHTHNRTQEEVAKALGKSRSHIANTVRLLNLPPQVVQYLRDGILTAGHARALVNANNAEELAKEIVSKGMNVRAAEELVNESPAGGKRRLIKKREKSVDTKALEDDLSNMIGMKVVIDSRNETSGTLKIEFKDLNQLDDLIERISGLNKGRLGE